MDHIKGSPGSLLEFIQTEMVPEPGKATLADLHLAKREMPDVQLATDMAAVPDCITEIVGIRDNGRPIVEIIPGRLAVLAWIQLRHENPDIQQDEVMKMISLAKGEAFVEFTKRVYWFWSDLPEEEFEKRWQERMKVSRALMENADITPLDEEPEEEVTDENPTTPSGNS